MIDGIRRAAQAGDVGMIRLMRDAGEPARTAVALGLLQARLPEIEIELAATN